VLKQAFEAAMYGRLKRLGVTGFLVLMTIVAAPPYVVNQSYSASAGSAIEARGNVLEYERVTIAIFDRVSPSVAQVTAILGANDSEGDEASSKRGTAFVWDAAGHMVTSYHVAQDAKSLMLVFASGDIRRASIVGVAPDVDLAVIRIDDNGPLPPPISIGSSEALKVGQAAFAIGNPFGLDQTLTSGIISGLKRRISDLSGLEATNVIQTDAAINPGNSGGPLLNSAGRLIGVNTALYSPSGSNVGIGYAIPVEVLNRVVPKLIRDDQMSTLSIGVAVGDKALAQRRLKGGKRPKAARNHVGHRYVKLR